MCCSKHPLQALYTVTETYQPSSPVIQLMVYRSAPYLSHTASTDTLQITPGEPSLPVKLQVSSRNGLTGTVKYACVGLPAE